MAIRVLYLHYQSDDAAPLGVDEERGAIEDRLAHASNGGAIELIPRANVEVDELPGLLAQVRPDVLHLTCHGVDGGRLVLFSRGEFKAIAPEAVTRIVGGAGSNLRLVVFNACYSEPVASAVAEQRRFAIGSTRRVPSQHAARFAAVLYELIAEGRDLQVASAQAINAAMAEDPTLFNSFKLKSFESETGAGLVLAPRPPPRAVAELAPPPTRARPHQLLLLLDAYEASVRLDEVEAWLDDHRDQRVKLRLSDQMSARGLPRIRNEDLAIDWPGMAEATQALVDAALSALPADDRPIDVLIGGNAPHPTFAHVGYALSSWGGRRQTIVHRNKDGAWVRLDLGEGQPTSGPRYFQRRIGMEAGRLSPSNGQVALFLNALGGDVPGSVEDLFHQSGRPLAGAVSLLHTTPSPDDPRFVTPMDRETGAAAAAELQRVSTELSGVYPNHTGLVLFVKGPDFLAFLAGRALNPRQISGGLGLAWFQRQTGAYQVAYTLPLAPDRPPVVPQDEGAKNRRRRVYDQIIDGLDGLRGSLLEEHLSLPDAFGAAGPGLTGKLFKALSALRPGREPQGQVFELSVPRRELKIGDGLLHAVVGMDEHDLRRFGRLLVLHELVHLPQRLLGTNYQGVGRAGVVLEELDYQADAFALLTATRWEIRDQGARGEREAGRILGDYLAAHRRALAAFDRMEQGARLDRLPERRLRRYLIWALQAARAETVTDSAGVEALLRARLFVELAPAPGRLDPRGDKLVLEPGPDAQLFVCLGGVLAREARLPENFEPAKLVEATRRLELDQLLDAMRFMVGEHGDLLTPWAA